MIANSDHTREKERLFVESLVRRPGRWRGDHPHDVAIVGFDDIPDAQWVRPRLTTVAQYPGEMGRKLATALFERITGDPDVERRVFQVPCRIIERESAA